MGSKYTVQVFGKHFGDEYSYMVEWAGQSLPRALLALWRASRKGFGCVTLECRL